VLLVAFVLPGFVTVLLQERTFRSADDPTPLDRLLRVVYYSVWTYLLLAMVALIVGVDRAYIEDLYDRYKSDPAELVWRGALAILLPAMVVATATRLWAGTPAQSKVLGWLRINERHEQPTGWDYFFRQRRNVYVRVTTTDGSRILGFYGAASFATYAKDGRDLYLERVYVPDQQGWFGPESPGNRGVWVKTDAVVSIEFYDPEYASQESATSSSTEAPKAGSGQGRPQAAPGDQSATSAAAPSAGTAQEERLIDE
jgi:Family of unknown function (DUF6338)